MTIAIDPNLGFGGQGLDSLGKTLAPLAAAVNANVGSTTPTATDTVAGTVKKAADVAAVTGATDTVCQTAINAILTSLKAAGIMA